MECFIDRVKDVRRRPIVLLRSALYERSSDRRRANRLLLAAMSTGVDGAKVLGELELYWPGIIRFRHDADEDGNLPYSTPRVPALISGPTLGGGGRCLAFTSESALVVAPRMFDGTR